MNRYAFYVELTSPVITIEADSKKEAEKIAEEYLHRPELQYKVMSNLYVGELWELKEE